jgi:hypothetical protein
VSSEKDSKYLYIYLFYYGVCSFLSDSRQNIYSQF